MVTPEEESPPAKPATGQRLGRVERFPIEHTDYQAKQIIRTRQQTPPAS